MNIVETIDRLRKHGIVEVLKWDHICPLCEYPTMIVTWSVKIMHVFADCAVCGLKGDAKARESTAARKAGTEQRRLIAIHLSRRAIPTKIEVMERFKEKAAEVLGLIEARRSGRE